MSRRNKLITILSIAIASIGAGVLYWSFDSKDKIVNPITATESEANQEIKRYMQLQLPALADVSPYFPLALRAGDIWYEQQSIDVPKNTISPYNRDGSINKDLKLDEIPNTLNLKTFVFTSPDDSSIKWILYVFEDQLGKPYHSSHTYTRLSVDEWYRTRRIEEIVQIIFDKTGASVDRSKVSNTESAEDISYEELRKQMVDEAVALHRRKNSELSQTLLKDFSGLPTPKEDDTTIQTYAELLESHSGNSKLYSLTTYSKLADEINDYAGELGTKSTKFFECKKSIKSCQPSPIVDKAIEAKLEGYYPGIGYCFIGWDAEKKRIFTQGCGAVWKSTLVQFNYEEDKFYSIGSETEPLTVLGLNRRLTMFALEKRTTSGPNHLYHPSTILIYNTENPSSPAKTIDLTRYIDINATGTVSFEFAWNNSNDGMDTTAQFTLQGKLYWLNAVSGEITPMF